MKKYKHKDCTHCFRSYFTYADQCVVPCKGIDTEYGTYTMDSNPTNRFLKYLIEINSIENKETTTKEERSRQFFLLESSKNHVYLHGECIPEYRHCRFQLTYPKWYPKLLRFRFITYIIRFWKY